MYSSKVTAKATAVAGTLEGARLASEMMLVLMHSQEKEHFEVEAIVFGVMSRGGH